MDKPKRVNSLSKGKTSLSHDAHIVKLLAQIDAIMAETNQVHNTFLRSQNQAIALYIMSESLSQKIDQTLIQAGHR